jgi:hypothetical protein
MLIATRPLNVFGKLVQPGNPIPSPEKWNPAALRSNINLGWVREATEQEALELEERFKNPPPPPERESRKMAKKTGDAENLTQEPVRCPECPDREFKSVRALAAHAARSHRR